MLALCSRKQPTAVELAYQTPTSAMYRAFMSGTFGRIFAALASALLCAAVAESQTVADSGGIRAASLDYIQGWYAGDAARMERALHPELAKRIVRTDRATQRSRVDQMGAMALVQGTRNGGGTQTPPGRRLDQVRILDVFENAASVRVDASDWVDYLHLGKVNGRWVIINVLWELRPRSPAQ
jgi:hypothetical protein